MKTEIITEQESEQAIDWSKVQLVESEWNIVLTTGKHQEDSFEGMVISDKGEGYKVGHFSIGWNKSCFKPITSPITIKFTP